jgi:hypothetical protein
VNNEHVFGPKQKALDEAATLRDDGQGGATTGPPRPPGDTWSAAQPVGEEEAAARRMAEASRLAGEDPDPNRPPLFPLGAPTPPPSF